MKKEALDRFIENVFILNDGIDINLYSSSIDAAFERICSALLKEQRGVKIWYDGTGDLRCEKNGDRKLVFSGNMHVMEGQSKHWIEPFSAEVSVTSIPSHCDVTVTCGEYKSSGNLYRAFGYT